MLSDGIRFYLYNLGTKMSSEIKVIAASTNVGTRLPTFIATCIVDRLLLFILGSRLRLSGSKRRGFIISCVACLRVDNVGSS